ncbi:MAG: YihY/virulence factor BrkB family protein [Bacteroidetes bacterium]|nr:YihY/virulence factor BrkB family protein [Bacteroidota bacterium]HET6244025.1 YihY/virulence factor BrkB family protein [Bacteroidia bacterium]
MQQKIFNYLKGLRTISAAIDWSKHLILPGFDGTPLYSVIKFFIQGVKKSSLTTRASALAFNFFIAIFPGLIFLFTLIPYIPIDDFQNQLLLLMKDILPYNAYESIKITIEDLVLRQRGGLLSIGFFLAVYFATNGFSSMIDAFNNSFYIAETRSTLMQFIISVALVFIITILILIAITFIVFSSLTLNYLLEKGILQDNYHVSLLHIGKWLVIVALLFFCFSFMYYIGPSKKSKFRFISAGSSLSTLLSILTSIGFAYYVNNFGQYNKLYGSIGTIIVILLWMQFNSLILLIGFELNASIKQGRLDREE